MMRLARHTGRSRCRPISRRASRALVATMQLSVVGLVLSCRETQEGPQDRTHEPSPAKPPRLPSATEGSTQDLQGHLARLRKTDVARYLPPEQSEDRSFRDWVGHHIDAVASGRLPALAPPSGFLGSFADDGRHWLLHEAPAKARGAGVLVLRAGRASDLIIEIPHGFFDTGTFTLGVHAYEALNARALVINTLHRGGLGSGAERIALARSGESPSDVAHADSSFFQLNHEQLIQAYPTAHVVQLHGFADEKIPDARIVVSAAGTTAATGPIAQALNDGLGAPLAKTYPDEVRQLGGTTNRQARASKHAQTRFVHLELSHSLRRQLSRDAGQRARFFDGLAKGLDLRP